jgi:hypothetical protein
MCVSVYMRAKRFFFFFFICLVGLVHFAWFLGGGMFFCKERSRAFALCCAHERILLHFFYRCKLLPFFFFFFFSFRYETLIRAGEIREECRPVRHRDAMKKKGE